jgi:peptidoglycan DL-endopeptidase CwlO
MSIPLRATFCAAVVAFSAVPGPTDAQSAATGYSPIVAYQRQSLGAKRKSARHNLHSQRGRAVLHAQMLAAAQRAVRRQRAQLVRQWERRARRAVRFAMKQRGLPYVWGGTGQGGYDCSGLVQRSWRAAGVPIPRVAHDQYRTVRKKVSRKRLRPGDLLLFNDFGHVGMYTGQGRFIHSPRTGRTVSVERLRGYWRGRLVGAVRPAWPRLPAIPQRLY